MVAFSVPLCLCGKKSSHAPSPSTLLSSPSTRLTLLARQVVEGYLSGIHRSPFKGFSVEFAEHPPVRPRRRDPPDRLATFGKTDKYFVKEYEEETNLRRGWWWTRAGA